MAGNTSAHTQVRGVRLLVAAGIALAALAAVGGLALAHSDASAAAATCTKTWTGNSSTLWTVNGNWAPSGAPGATDYVCIPSTSIQPSLANGNTISIAGLRQTGDTLTINGTSSITVTNTDGTKSSEFTAGTIQGNGSFVVGANHTASWDALGFLGAGTTTVSAGATVNLTITLSSNAIVERPFVNNGTINYTPGAPFYSLYFNGFTCASSPTFTNNGAFVYKGLASSDPGIQSCGTPSFVNSATGTFTRTLGTGSATVAVPFTNTGAVSAQAGTLVFNTPGGTNTGSWGATGGGGVSLQSATFDFGTGAAFTGGVSVNGATANVISGGTLTLTGTDAFTAGFVTGPGSMTVNGTLTWTGGNFIGTGSTTIANGGTVNANPSVNYLIIDERAFTNNGTFNYTSNVSGWTLYLSAQTCSVTTTFTNNGTFNWAALASGDNGIQQCFASTIVNSATGTFTKTAGGPATIQSGFENDGTVTSNADLLGLAGGGGAGTSTGQFATTGTGVISFDGGTFPLGVGSSFSGNARVTNGIVQVGAAVTINNLTVTGGEIDTNAAVTVTNLSLSGGSVAGTSSLTVNGTLTWTGGNFIGTGSTTIANGGTVNANPSVNYLIIDERAFTNNGTFNYTSNVSGWTLYLSAQTCSVTTTFTNNGTFNWAALASGDNGIQQCFASTIINSATGTFTKTAGGAVSVMPSFENDGTVTSNAGTLAFNGGGSGTSTGQFGTGGGGLVTLTAGDFHLGSGASFSGEAAIAGATVYVDGPVTVSNLAFSSGTVAGASSLTVNGTLTWTGGYFIGTGSTTIAVGGTVNANPSVGYLVIEERSFTNNGTFNYTSNVAGWSLYLSGNSCSVTTTFTNNGTFNWAALASSDVGIQQCFTSTIVNGNGATFTKTAGGGAPVYPDFDNNGTIGVTTGKLTLNGAFPAYNSGTKTLTKGTYNLTGTLQFVGAAITHNQASLTFNTSSALLQDTSAGNAMANFNDNQATGSLTVTGGKSLAVKPLTNAGTVTVNASSTLSMNNGPYTQSGGTTTVNGNPLPGSLTSTGTGAAITINGGVLQGSGTLTPSTTNAASVRPGATGATAILTVAGGFTQSATGSYNAEIGGTTAGTGYDKIAATGAANLNGTLNLSTINGFTPTIGNTFTIMSFASRTGCFSAISGRDLSAVGAGLFYDVACNATDVTVTVKRAELSVNDVSATEGDSGTQTYTFTVSLNQARPDLAISVGWATSPGTATAPADFTSGSGPLSWIAGDGTSKTFGVTVKGDTLDEPDEAFTVALSGATNAYINDSSGTGTILDNDPPPTVSINDVTLTEGQSGTKAFTFTISLSAASGKATSVNWASADGTALQPTDYAAASGTANFPAGTTSQQATVNVNGDVTAESDETFTVNLTSPVDLTVNDGTGTGTITNDDFVPVITGFQPLAQVVKKPITILGSGFTGTTRVPFAKAGGGTVNATTFNVVDDGHLTVTVPTGATTGTVSVTNPTGTGASATAFKVKPKVKVFSPTSGPVGTLVTITGTSFTGTTKVQFGTKLATFTVVTDGKITATVPTGALTAPITVTTPGGKSKTKVNFTVS